MEQRHRRVDLCAERRRGQLFPRYGFLQLQRPLGSVGDKARHGTQRIGHLSVYRGIEQGSEYRQHQGGGCDSSELACSAGAALERDPRDRRTPDDDGPGAFPACTFSIRDIKTEATYR